MSTQLTAYDTYKQVLQYALSIKQEKVDPTLLKLRKNSIDDFKMIARKTGLSIKVTDESEYLPAPSEMPKYITENGDLATFIEKPSIVYQCDTGQCDLYLNGKNATAVKAMYEKLTHKPVEEKLHSDASSVLTLYNVNSPNGVGELLAKSGITRQSPRDFVISKW